MRTTVRLDEGLLKQAKAEASRQGQTVTALIERGLRLVLATARGPRRRARLVLPVSRASGGVRPGVDLNDATSVLDIIDQRS